MCGIAGIYRSEGPQDSDLAVVTHLLESMRYRGPDHLGLYCEGKLHMGNVRLAIQGIDASGNQPIYNEDRSVGVVLN